MESKSLNAAMKSVIDAFVAQVNAGAGQAQVTSVPKDTATLPAPREDTAVAPSKCPFFRPIMTKNANETGEPIRPYDPTPVLDSLEQQVGHPTFVYQPRVDDWREMLPLAQSGGGSPPCRVPSFQELCFSGMPVVVDAGSDQRAQDGTHRQDNGASGVSAAAVRSAGRPPRLTMWGDASNAEALLNSISLILNELRRKWSEAANRKMGAVVVEEARQILKGLMALDRSFESANALVALYVTGQREAFYTTISCIEGIGTKMFQKAQQAASLAEASQASNDTQNVISHMDHAEGNATLDTATLRMLSRLRGP